MNDPSPWQAHTALDERAKRGAGLRLLGGMTCLSLAIVAGNASAQIFTDVTVNSGIDYEQYSNQSEYLDEAHYMTGGAAAADYDDDGWTDLYVTRMIGVDVLYRNAGNGTFVEIPPVITGLDAGDGSNGAFWADVDNDGDLDLYITTVGVGHNLLYVNEGGFFTEQGEARGADVLRSGRNPTAATFGASFADYDADGYLDLFVCAWADRGGEGTRLLRNGGSEAPGIFSDATTAGGVALQDYPNSLGIGDIVFAFSSQFADLDLDGHQDLVVAADFLTSRVFWNQGDGTFTDGNPGSGFGTDENGMGLAIGDCDDDGVLDVFVTSIYDPLNTCSTGECSWGNSGNRLYRSDGNRQFSDWTQALGVENGGWGWGASFLDCDRDMDTDLVMTNGFDYPGILSEDDLFHDDPVRLWSNPGTSPFVEIAAQEGLTDTRDGKGLLTLDYDNDGDVDLFVVNNADPPVLYRNDSAGNWLQVVLQGVLSNPRGLGAQIDVIAGGRIQSRLVASGGFLGDSDKIATFGLAQVPLVDVVRVRWPRGNIQLVTNVAINQRLVVTEDVGGSTSAPSRAAIARLHPPYPNPFNPDTTVTISLARAGSAALSIYDLRGRRVRSLHRGWLPAGESRFPWRGKDSRGRSVASGAYLVELEAEGHRLTRRIELLK